MRDAAEKILTLVVPVYNESSLIGRSFDAIAAFMSGFEPGTAEVIFVNDGSPDNSGELLARCLDGRDPQTFRLISYATRLWRTLPTSSRLTSSDWSRL